MRTVLTLARQTGCGASHIGSRVAKRLGATFVDRQLLTLTAAGLGREENEIEDRDERLSTRWEKLLSAFSGFSIGPPEAPYTPEPVHPMSDEELFETQSRILHQLAHEQDCVIVGRGGSWVLRDVPGHLPIFLHAPLEWRVTRLCASGVAKSGREARQIIEHSDACRNQFLRKVASRDWAEATQYFLTVDTSRAGLDGTVDLIVDFVERIRPSTVR
jgi:cytidylate kinase